MERFPQGSYWGCPQRTCECGTRARMVVCTHRTRLLLANVGSTAVTGLRTLDRPRTAARSLVAAAIGSTCHHTRRTACATVQPWLLVGILCCRICKRASFGGMLQSGVTLMRSRAHTRTHACTQRRRPGVNWNFEDFCRVSCRTG